MTEFEKLMLEQIGSLREDLAEMGERLARLEGRLESLDGPGPGPGWMKVGGAVISAQAMAEAARALLLGG